MSSVPPSRRRHRPPSRPARKCPSAYWARAPPSPRPGASVRIPAKPPVCAGSDHACRARVESPPRRGDLGRARAKKEPWRSEHPSCRDRTNRSRVSPPSAFVAMPSTLPRPATAGTIAAASSTRGQLASGRSIGLDPAERKAARIMRRGTAGPEVVLRYGGAGIARHRPRWKPRTRWSPGRIGGPWTSGTGARVGPPIPRQPRAVRPLASPHAG